MLYIITKCNINKFMKKTLTVLSGLLVWGFCLLAVNGYAQQKVAGQVIDSLSGDPLPGATITTHGGKTGTISGGEGEFSLSVSSGDTIVVSVLGYDRKKIVYSGRNKITIAMSQGSHILNQLVVVGYGEQKRSDLSGAVATLDDKVVKHSNVSNVELALQGQLPGLRVQQSTVQPCTSLSMTFYRGTHFIVSDTPHFVD